MKLFFFQKKKIKEAKDSTEETNEFAEELWIFGVVFSLHPEGIAYVAGVRHLRGETMPCVSVGRELWSEGRRGEGSNRSLSDENSLGMADYHLQQTGNQHCRFVETVLFVWNATERDKLGGFSLYCWAFVEIHIDI